MAKSATFITLLFAFALLLAAFETPMVAGRSDIAVTVHDGVRLCDVPSGTWSGHCGNSANCDRQCRDREHFSYGGACHYKFPSFRSEGIALAKEHGCLFLECSAKTRQNVEQCFEELALKIFTKIMEVPSLLEEGRVHNSEEKYIKTETSTPITS